MILSVPFSNKFKYNNSVMITCVKKILCSFNICKRQLYYFASTVLLHCKFMDTRPLVQLNVAQKSNLHIYIKQQGRLLLNVCQFFPQVLKTGSGFNNAPEPYCFVGIDEKRILIFNGLKIG